AATVPSAVVQATVGAAVAVAAARSATGVASATVAAAVKEATKAVGLTKCKLATALVLAVGAVAGAGMVGMGGLPEEGGSETPPAAKAAARPKAEEDKQNRVDCYGDPLPEGAIARMGTVRWRLGPFLADCMVVSPDGKWLLAAHPKSGLTVLEMETG